MIRYSLLLGFVIFLSAYAWRDWFKATCGLVILMAVLERPDMPRTMMGIPGLNPFNFTLLVILAAWISQRRIEKPIWDMPAHLLLLLGSYIGFLLLSGQRIVADPEGIRDYLFMIGASPVSTVGLVRDYILNTIKWLIPAFLIYDGCRDREQAKWAVGCVLITLFLLAAQIVRLVGLGAVLDYTDFQQRAARVIGRDIGYHRVDLSTVMAGATWAFFCARTLVQPIWAQRGLLGLAAFGGFACLLTAGRGGYLACVITGFVLALIRWRWLLLLGPVLGLLILISVPELRQRAFEGFTEDTHEGSSLAASSVDASGRDWHAITSGRILIWPLVTEKILERPFFGHGGQAMIREGITILLCELYGPVLLVANPHNAYLQWILDNGIVAAIPVFLFFGLIVRYSLRLFRRQDPLRMAVGGICFAMVFSQLVGSIGGQTFYPREGTVLMWCMIALCLRFHVAEEQAGLLYPSYRPPTPQTKSLAVRSN